MQGQVVVSVELDCHFRDVEVLLKVNVYSRM